jgi:iron complex outermembrane recepter protein
MLKANLRSILLASAAVVTLGATPGSAMAKAVAATTVVQQAAPPATETPNDAQTVDDAATASSNQIVITARRRAETLQNVPIAVTAFSGEQLDRQGALDITDIGNSTPNATIEVSRGTNSTLTAFIRGVGQQDPVAGFEQGVGLYLDDVYLNRPQASVLDIYDVQRIEVLRGPQGTLYGRNTIGGAVKYVTRRLAEVPTMSIRGNLGSYRQADVVVSASLPVTAGVRVGGSFARLSRGGFGRNLTTGRPNYNKDVTAGRGTIEIQPSEALSVRLSGDYTRDNSAPRSGHREIVSLLTGAPILDNVFDSRGGILTPQQRVAGGGLAAHADLKVAPGITLRSITAWRKDKSTSPIDFDSLPSADIDVAGLYANKQFSQEGQVLIEQGALNGVVGAYYLDADARTAFDTRIFTTISGLAASTDARVGTRTTAVFGDFSYDLTDQFSVSLGGRYTWDKRTGNIFRQNYVGGGSLLFGGAGIPFGAPATNFQGSRKFKRFTPRASLSFKPSRAATFYASYGQGFKGGSFDPRGVGINAPDLNNNGVKDQNEVAQFISFRPETVTSYELGYKGSPLPGLDIAAAVFHANYKDVQIPGSAPCTVNGIASFCGVTANAGKARFEGVELEANARLGRDLMSAGDRLSLSGTMGYINADYKKYVSLIAGQTLDVAAFRNVQNTPKWTASGTLDYNAPLASGRIDVNTTLSFRSKTYQFEIANPFLDQKAYSLLDANLVWKSNRFSFGVHGKNLLNKLYRTSGYTFLSADPRTGELIRRTAPVTLTSCGVPRVSPIGAYVSATGCEGTLTTFYGNPRQVWLSFGVTF